MSHHDNKNRLEYIDPEISRKTIESLNDIKEDRKKPLLH